MKSNVFTLIELLAVPKVFQYIETTRRAADNATIRNLKDLTARTIVKNQSSYDEILNDEDRYAIIREDESTLPIPMQKGGRFKWDKDNNIWSFFKSSPPSYVRRTASIEEHTSIVELTIQEGIKSVVLTDIHVVPIRNTTSWGMNFSKKIDRELDELIIQDLPDTTNKNNPFRIYNSNNALQNTVIKKFVLPNYTFVYGSVFMKSTFKSLYIGKNSTLSHMFFAFSNIGKLTLDDEIKLETFVFRDSSIEEIIIGNNCNLGPESLKVKNLKKIIIGDNVAMLSSTVSNSFYNIYTTNGAGTYTIENNI